MKIGIDISQTAYEGTGVANYVKNLVENLLAIDDKNKYILFESSLRQSSKYKVFSIKYKHKRNVSFKIFPFPPTLLDFLWNRLHILPIEWFIGDVDVFISSDWTQPPTAKAKKATILYDLIVYKYPDETHNKFEFSLKNLSIKQNIVVSQKRRLHWVKKECDIIFCISEATKKDAMEILGIPEEKLKVIYPGT
jgi:glycosyltransferase involved in cell wall biosynthesis